MNCPSCGLPMTAKALEGYLGAPVTVDLCLPCQVLWFDRHESLRLSPGATLQLFKIMGDEVGNRQPPLPLGTRCPRCRVHLLSTHDMQRSTRFQYWRCPAGHGRMIAFYDFLREKDFIRPLSPPQIAELSEKIRSVNCVNCGAPIDLMKGSTCAHCGTPLSILDMSQPDRLIAELQQADARRGGGNPPSPQDGDVTREGDTAD